MPEQSCAKSEIRAAEETPEQEVADTVPEPDENFGEKGTALFTGGSTRIGGTIAYNYWESGLIIRYCSLRPSNR